MTNRPPSDALDDELLALATVGVSLAARAPVAPSPGLKDRLMARIREERFQFVHADDGQWTPEPNDPTVEAKLLYEGAHGDRTRLLRVLPSDDVRALRDARDPAVLVVSGALSRDEVSCGPGDFAQEVPDDSPSWRVTAPATLLVVERGGSASSRRAPVIPAPRDGWHTMAPGVRMHPLSAGPDESVDVLLLEMDADSVLPEHEHGGLEEIFLLRGSCHAQGRRIRAGDYHRAGEGTAHEPTSTDEGCLMIVVLRRAA